MVKNHEKYCKIKQKLRIPIYYLYDLKSNQSEKIIPVF